MFNKILTIIIFFTFSILTSAVNAASLTFPAATYQGEVKKGKANGVGVFTFEDGSTYEGKVKLKKIKFMAKGNIQMLKEKFMRESLSMDLLK